MIRRRESLEVVVRLDRSGILRLGISHRSSILGQLPVHNIISNIPTKKESLMRSNSIRRERRSLEQIEESTRMERLLSIMQADFGVLARHAGEESCSQFKFDTPSDLIVELDFGVEGVGRGPTLSQGDSAVGVFALEFAGDGACCQDISGFEGSTNFGVLVAFDGEEDAVGGFRLDF